MSSAKRYTPDAPSTSKGFSFTFKKRAWLLYFFLFPLGLAVIVALFRVKILAFVFSLLAFVLVLVSAKLSNYGFDNEQAYRDSTLAKAPKVPFKLISALALGVGSFVSITFAGGGGIVQGLFLGVLASIGHLLYYGIDPHRDKLIDVGDVSVDFVLETLTEAKEKVARITQGVAQIADATIKGEFNTTLDRAREIIDKLEHNPKNIRGARKFLITYIDSLEKVSSAYLAIDEEVITSQSKEELRALLIQSQKRFETELRTLKEEGNFDLDVHMDVLREHIKSDTHH